MPAGTVGEDSSDVSCAITVSTRCAAARDTGAVTRNAMTAVAATAGARRRRSNRLVRLGTTRETARGFAARPWCRARRCSNGEVTVRTYSAGHDRGSTAIRVSILPTASVTSHRSISMARPRAGIVYVGLKATVAALDRRTGAEVWRTPLKGGMGRSSSFVTLHRDGDILYAGIGGEVWALDPKSGTVL